LAAYLERDGKGDPIGRVGSVVQILPGKRRVARRRHAVDFVAGRLGRDREPQRIGVAVQVDDP
jgi:hypothetical protein